ncbi:MAG: hypothetical protein V3U44_08640, partial [Alphaproteobacteria bacterium]
SAAGWRRGAATRRRGVRRLGLLRRVRAQPVRVSTRSPEAERPFRCPFYPVVPGLFLVLATAMAIASFLKSDWISRILGPGVLMAGVVVFFLYRRFRREAD